MLLRLPNSRSGRDHAGARSGPVADPVWPSRVHETEPEAQVNEDGPVPKDSTSDHARKVRRLSRTVAVVSLTLAAAAVVFAAFSVVRYFGLRDDARNVAESNAVAATAAAAASVDDLLGAIAGGVDRLAADLSSGAVDDGLADQLSAETTEDRAACGRTDQNRSTLPGALCATAAAVPELNGIGVIFDPSVDPDTVYRPYANRIAGPLRLGSLEPRDPLATDWYVAAAESGAGWTEPRFGATSKTLLAIYSAPFTAADGSLRGVVIATYTLNQLADDLRWLGVGSTGYSIILSESGMLLSHPESRRVERAFGEEPPPSTGLVAALEQTLADEVRATGLVTGLADDVTGNDAWLAYAPITTVGWTYGAAVLENEVVQPTRPQNRRIIDTTLALLAAALLVGVVVFRAHEGSGFGLWTVSIAAGLAALAAMGVIWFVTITGTGATAEEDSRGLGDIAVSSAGTAPVFAGVFVQSVEFTGANDVNVSGLAWQQQRSDESSLGPPGFVLPEADEALFVEQYRQVTGNSTRVGWAFTASLRQSFDYSRYPLDRETVWLRLWTADYAADAPLLPDLTSYTTLAPSTKPGVERTFIVEGWTVEASSFSYRDNRYNTNFGLRDQAGAPSIELYFNVHLKRSFLDALMSQLVPLLVVALLLFGVLLITTEERILSETLGFSTLAVLGYCAALFFVVIVSHNDLRAELQAQQIIYLEYFYFAAYAAILGVSANAILVGSGRGGRVIAYRNNTIPSLLFWPVMHGALLLVTLVAFY